MPLSHNPFAFSVPASSANLGPGFDSIALALQRRMYARVECYQAFRLSFTPGRHAPTHDGISERIVQAMRRLGRLPRVRITIKNEIPLGKGLGSSAAAIALGLSIAARLRRECIDRSTMEQLAVELEGHPENALAALHGGIVVAAQRAGAPPSFIRLPAPRMLFAVVTIPKLELSTSQARALLPASYSKADLIFTAQRAALLAAALACGEWQHLREAMRDRSHQPHRFNAVPGLRAALDVHQPELLGVALSGAGPSILALMQRASAYTRVASAIERCFSREGIASESFALRVTSRGAMAWSG